MTGGTMKLGWKKDPHSDKDYKFDQLKNRLSAVSFSGEHIIPENFPIYDQLSLNSCVANATCGALEILMGLKQSNPAGLSRLFVYWNARVYTKETDRDEGTYIRNAFDSLRTLGVCLENAWKYDPGMVFAQPNLESYKEGDDNTIDSFYRIDSTGSQRLDDIETAIRANHPVVFGTGVSREFTQYTGGGKVWGPPSSSIGGHAMVVVGVRIASNGAREFLIRNSWGTSWGDDGHCWFNEDYLMSDQTNDLWVPTLVPALTV
jgi:C1A family cysteine protease